MNKSAAALLVIALVLVSATGAPRAQATISSLTLSTHSSNSTPYTEPQHLDATLDFEVVDNELTLIVTNTTNVNPDPDYQFDIAEVYFNYNDTISSLWWADGATSGWALQDSPYHVDLFGYFDVRLYLSAPPKDKWIKPGDSETFVLNFGGSGSAEDFTTYLSAPNGSDTLGYAAAQFVHGGPDDNILAYGMVVPEPATLALLGLGSLLLLGRKRRA